MTQQSLEKMVRELADREAIRELTHRYCDSVWRQDVTAIANCFTDDGEFQHGQNPPARGREDIAKFYASSLRGGGPYPYIHNHIIELAGDQATGKCFVDIRTRRNGKGSFLVGWYRDEYMRIGSEWKFKSRKVTVELQTSFMEA